VPKLVPVSGEKLIRYFRRKGLKVSHQKGDHVSMTGRDMKRPVVIQKSKSIPVWIIKKNLNTAGISREEFLREF